MRRISTQSSGWRPGDSSPAGIDRCITASKKALGDAPLQLFQLHHTDGCNDLAATLRAVRRRVDAGDILAVGLSNATVADITLARSIVPIVCVENKLSLYERQAEKDIPTGGRKLGKTNQSGTMAYCRRHGIAFVAYGCLGGLRSRDGRADMPGDFPQLSKLAAARGVSLQSMTLAYFLQKYPDVLLPIVGHRSSASLRDTHAGVTAVGELTAAEMAAFDAAKCSPRKSKR
jgi:aryl-alcohol dehydrogenase-like predicted oxidoreductase